MPVTLDENSGYAIDKKETSAMKLFLKGITSKYGINETHGTFMGHEWVDAKRAAPYASSVSYRPHDGLLFFGIVYNLGVICEFLIL